MDRNTTIGFVLIGLLLIAMFYFNSKNRLAYEAGQKRIEDSLARLKPQPVQKKSDSTGTVSPGGNVISQSGFGELNKSEQVVRLENDLISISFSSKGAKPGSVTLKQFTRYDKSPVVINNSEFDRFSYRFNSAVNKTSATDDFIFNVLPIRRDGQSQTVTFVLSDTSGRSISHEYTLKDGDYMLDCKIRVKGASTLFTGNNISFQWNVQSPCIEKDHKYELIQSHFCYRAKDGYDFDYMQKPNSKDLDKVDWVCFKQQFFLSALVAKTPFSRTATEWSHPAEADAGLYLSRSTTSVVCNIPAGDEIDIPLQFFFGPSDYNILSKYGNGMENIVPYGTGIFAFVKYINRHFLLPVFDFFRMHIGSMGMVILLLTLLIRLITSPILYKSYLSGAKMKVLKPEVDALKEKYKDDQQTFGMEQMKLWRSAGVSPLGGCLPALLQIPIFMSLYYFFQSNIDLRGKSFLWAKDLAQYDSIYQLPFNVPFYGNHISLFTLTAVVTSLLISLYSMSNMQDNSNPLMKYMPYIFPVLLLGVFNNLPSALTWYYTISNTITLILQVIIQKYIINHDKILAEIEENRKKPVKKSKMQERIEAMQESQKKLQEMKNKSNRN